MKRLKFLAILITTMLLSACKNAYVPEWSVQETPNNAATEEYSFDQLMLDRNKDKINETVEILPCAEHLEQEYCYEPRLMISENGVACETTIMDTNAVNKSPYILKTDVVNDQIIMLIGYRPQLEIGVHEFELYVYDGEIERISPLNPYQEVFGAEKLVPSPNHPTTRFLNWYFDSFVSLGERQEHRFQFHGPYDYAYTDGAFTLTYQLTTIDNTVNSMEGPQHTYRSMNIQLVQESDGWVIGEYSLENERMIAMDDMCVDNLIGTSCTSEFIVTTNTTRQDVLDGQEIVFSQINSAYAVERQAASLHVDEITYENLQETVGCPIYEYQNECGTALIYPYQTWGYSSKNSSPYQGYSTYLFQDGKLRSFMQSAAMEYLVTIQGAQSNGKTVWTFTLAKYPCIEMSSQENCLKDIRPANLNTRYTQYIPVGATGCIVNENALPIASDYSEPGENPGYLSIEHIDDKNRDGIDEILLFNRTVRSWALTPVYILYWDGQELIREQIYENREYFQTKWMDLYRATLDEILFPIYDIG